MTAPADGPGPSAASPTKDSWMFRLLSLTLAAFAIGISEFVLVGLLPAIAADVHADLGTAGLLVTVYALAITLFSPLLTSWLSRYDSRAMLAGLMALFALGNLAVAVSPNLMGLMLGRAAAGAAHGTVFALGAPVAASLVPRGKAGRAIALMFLGLTVAMVIGVPVGTAIGTAIGWRATFILVAALGLAAALALWALLPSASGERGVLLREQLALLAHRPLALTYTVTALGFGATFAVFTYLGPLLTRHAGYTAPMVTWTLVLFGAATVAGNLAGGRLTDRRGAILTIRLALAGLIVSLAALLTTQDHSVAVAVNIAAWGVFAFLISPAVQTHAVALASCHGPGAEKAASGLNIAAFNAGIAAASFVGGLVLEHGDPARTPWAAIALALAALVATTGIAVRPALRRGANASG
ncbi:MFS transporter [Streptomyces sp. PRKS01-29]|nr:MFS transporter [Streptomyces sabulosicollis]MBI0293149.1 MFS transporter [Streptomyces sabulosicollis]